MDRRMFLAGSLGIGAAAMVPGALKARQATPEAGTALPSLGLTLTDTAFEFDQPLRAGRFEITVTNAGTLTDSHFALGRIPDRVTDAEYAEWFATQSDEGGPLTFEDIDFVGVPDWPSPGGSVAGVIDIAPGRYFLFDPFTGREAQSLVVEGEFGNAPEPASDATVVLREMEIVLPDTALTTGPVRWKIENVGGMSHEVAVLAVSPDFTAEHLNTLLMLPESATPPPDVPELVYQPVAAIGILAKGHTSWLDVQLGPGHYVAVCMLPFSTGYPHVMDGMLRFFDLE